MDASVLLIIIVLLLLLIIFRDRIGSWASERYKDFSIQDKDIKKTLDAYTEKLEPASPVSVPDPTLQPQGGVQLPPGQASETLNVLGYVGAQPWDEVIAATELDPSTFVNHYEFVKDVRRFSSGSNFTAIDDSDTNLDFVNFIGLRRPEHVPIGDTARQIPDIDQTVLQRNKRYAFVPGPDFSKPYNERCGNDY